MKNGKIIMLSICILFLTLTVGIFIGRNTRMDIYEIPQNEIVNTDEKQTDFRVDINSMSVAQLKELPGIGELLAQRIAAYREANGPFRTIDELMNVEGIGEKKLEQIAKLAKVGG